MEKSLVQMEGEGGEKEETRTGDNHPRARRVHAHEIAMVQRDASSEEVRRAVLHGIAERVGVAENVIGFGRKQWCLVQSYVFFAQNPCSLGTYRSRCSGRRGCRAW